ncbi:MAG: nucleoside triphosphate pyrophosphatase [Solirubrobacterales bacterium]
MVEPDVDEIGEGQPQEVVLENARRKARAGLAAADLEATALGADTEVVLEGRVLGKAGNEEVARASLEALSGRTHEVLTGVALLGPGSEGAERSGIASSRVTFRELDPAILGRYLASGEWRDRAGAYAIQGLGSILINRLEGDFSNVVGLPVPLLLDLAPELFD